MKHKMSCSGCDTEVALVKTDQDGTKHYSCKCGTCQTEESPDGLSAKFMQSAPPDWAGPTPDSWETITVEVCGAPHPTADDHLFCYLPKGHAGDHSAYLGSFEHPDDGEIDETTEWASANQVNE